MARFIPCQHCEEGTFWKSRYGGNDPDVWATKCNACDGTGTVGCDECGQPATNEFRYRGADYPMRDRHYAEWRASEDTADEEAA